MSMKNDVTNLFGEKVRDFRLPRYRELPDMGLYLEQVTKYINGYLTPLGCPEMTSSMVSNYVKKGVISSPVKKLYYAEQIAYLIFISVAKSVLSLENIARLFEMQRATYDPETAYDYFCSEFLNMLWFVGGLKDTVDSVGVTNSEAKTILRSVIIGASHILFAESSFEIMRSGDREA